MSKEYEFMEIVIELNYPRLSIAKYISETDKLYKVESIDNIRWENRCWKRQINKKDCLYKGDLSLEVADIIDSWNDALKEESDSISQARKIREEKIDFLRGKLNQQFKENYQ